MWVSNWFKTNLNKEITINKIINNVPKTTLYTLIIRFFGVLLLFYITYFITHNFKVSEVGSYDFSRSLLLFIAVVSILGNDQIVLYFSGKLKESKDKVKLYDVYLKCLSISGISSIILFIGAVIFINTIYPYFSDDLETSSTIFKTFLVVFLYSISQFNTEFMRAIDKPIISELYRNIFKFIFFYLGLVLTIYYEFNYSLVDLFLFSFCVVFIFSFIPLFKFLRDNYNRKPSSITFKEILDYTYPIAISNVSIVLFSTIDVFLIKFFLNEEALAYYSLCLKLITIPSIIIMSFNANISIEISHLFMAKKTEKLQEVIRTNSRIIMLLCLPIVLCLIFFSENVLLFFGEDYLNGKKVLIILALGQITNCFFGTLFTYVSMTNKQKFYQKILVIMIFVNLIMNYVLIPQYGIVGAAVTNVTCLFFYTVFMVFYIYKKDKILITVY